MERGDGGLQLLTDREGDGGREDIPVFYVDIATRSVKVLENHVE